MKTRVGSRWFSFSSLLMMLAIAGCSDDGAPMVAGTEGGDTGTHEQTSGDSASATSTSGGTTTADSDGGMEGGNFIDPGTDDGTPEAPNGAECSSNSDCQSGYCYVVPFLGGVCSECLQDADCDDGTCSLEFEAGYAVCTDGSQGKMCDSDEGCQGDLVCAKLIDTAFFDASYCSECNDDTPCPDHHTCSPHYDESNFSGHMYCAEHGSVPDGGGCPIENGEGNGEVCTNGHCGIADFAGFIEFGVCGSCSTHEDCDDGQTCTPASAGDQGLQGAYCE